MIVWQMTDPVIFKAVPNVVADFASTNPARHCTFSTWVSTVNVSASGKSYIHRLVEKKDFFNYCF
jgi:hypothetical protein